MATQEQTPEPQASSMAEGMRKEKWKNKNQM